MFQLKTILVPVDFSDRSTAAAEHAAFLAERFDSRVILVYVRPRLPAEDTGVADLYKAEVEAFPESELTARFHRLLDVLVEKKLPGRNVEKMVLAGDPAEKVAELVTQCGVDLVMIPTQGHGPFRKFLVGSVTAKVLHDVSCPVFTSAHVAAMPPYRGEGYGQVACALDLSEKSEDLLRWAWDYAQAWEAELAIIHAAPFVEVHFDRAHIVTADWRGMAARGAEEEIEKLIEKVGCRAAMHVDNGHPVHFVTSTADKIEADVLIIGRGLARETSRLPTHAYGIVRESPCPVISV